MSKIEEQISVGNTLTALLWAAVDATYHLKKLALKLVSRFSLSTAHLVDVGLSSSSSDYLVDSIDWRDLVVRLTSLMEPSESPELCFSILETLYNLHNLGIEREFI